MAVLGREVEGGQDAHAALAFLATAIKDHGAVSASIELHRYLCVGQIKPECDHVELGCSQHFQSFRRDLSVTSGDLGCK